MSMTRRSFLQLLGVASASAIGVGTYNLMPDLRWNIQRWLGWEGPTPMHIMQMVGNNSTSRTIVFESATPLTAAQIEVETPTGKSIIYPVMDETFTDGGDTIYWYRSHIDELAPHTSYTYRIVSKSGATDWTSLQTAGESDIRAIIFPDSQCSDYAVWKKTAQEAFKSHENAQFFINMGDLVDNGEDNTQWHQWTDAIEPNVHNIPVAPIMGNHETYTLDWKERM